MPYKKLAKKMPPFIFESARRAEELTRGFFTGGTLFEQLGFYYVGPIDGHNFDHLLPVLQNVRDAQEGPILVHVVTQKGKGYAPAEAAADKLHGTTIPYQDGYTVLTIREPHGVTGHIVPWNYPMQIFGRSVGGALAAGNVCVVKPAEDACLSLIRVAQLAAGWACLRATPESGRSAQSFPV
jgi:hypothetical protein